MRCSSTEDEDTTLKDMRQQKLNSHVAGKHYQ